MKTTRSKVRFLCLILVLAAVCAAFAGCSSGKTESGKPSVVVTVFPIYDWVRQIAGDRVDITLLLDRGVDLHSYQPTADDVVRISTADMFIFVGGESDAWVDDIIAGAKNGDLIPLDLIEELGDRAKEEEIKEGMQAEEEEDDEEEGPEYDEHIWLSLKNASVLCGVIAEKLCAIDPDGADAYGGAAADYVSKLDELDKEYEKAVGDAKIKTVLFGDRFPFRYLVDDYGLDYY
ncbi:MAG: zinc ABC transporter substrate-binding protein, partial [Clostridia bacterium]|nr:zinc ABC transporter substrate-binding protein [Clostridia bacterium]